MANFRDRAIEIGSCSACGTADPEVRRVSDSSPPLRISCSLQRIVRIQLGNVSTCRSKSARRCHEQSLNKSKRGRELLYPSRLGQSDPPALITEQRGFRQVSSRFSQVAGISSVQMLGGNKEEGTQGLCIAYY